MSFLKKFTQRDGQFIEHYACQNYPTHSFKVYISIKRKDIQSFFASAFIFLENNTAGIIEIIYNYFVLLHFFYVLFSFASFINRVLSFF